MVGKMVDREIFKYAGEWWTRMMWVAKKVR